MARQLAQLREIPLASVSALDLPTLKIQTDEDVDTWRQSRSYQDYAIFLRRLNESVVGRDIPTTDTSPSEATRKIIALLDSLDAWIDEIPPQVSPQRFGNLAFRTWGRRLEEESDALLGKLLPPAYAAVIPQVKPYLLTSFGSFGRMDYGTGHETSFALFLLCLALTRFLHPVPDEERSIVLTVFPRYLRLCWRLQDIYRLEPAGSHGVWGLDDSSFLGYVFGSGQLRDQTDIPVSAVLHPPLPATNLYFMSITRIHQVKHGPFHEHSSQLHSIATGVPNWAKVNSGLFKMYEAEVLLKRVVVQHIPLGGLLQWDEANATSMSAPTATTTVDTLGATRAPWASSTPAPSTANVSSWYSNSLPAVAPRGSGPSPRAMGASSTPAATADAPGATRAPWASSAPAPGTTVSSWYSSPAAAPQGSGAKAIGSPGGPTSIPAPTADAPGATRAPWASSTPAPAPGTTVSSWYSNPLPAVTPRSSGPRAPLNPPEL
ncbi:PTPA-domain-containing protein [Mycena olivaceomarginata]|nr:PTPA-domain-containing protein [Mycena olivaceomarginata]